MSILPFAVVAVVAVVLTRALPVLAASLFVFLFVEFLGIVGGVFVASGVGECVYVRLRMWRRLVSVLESGLGLDARRSIYKGELGLCL